MGLLDGKKIFVSGGSRGLGKAMCEIFAREGADIGFNYQSNDAGAAQTIALVEQYGRKALAFKVSVTDGIALKRVAKEFVEQFGTIDILVNNAAINKADSFVTTTEQSWLEVINVNVNGLYYVTKPFFKQMMRNRSGKILNITSIAAIRAVPTSVHYATAKSAVIGFTKCLSREAGAFGVSVNAIAAGLFETDLGNSLPEAFRNTYESWCSMGRFGEPNELAEFAAFLVSDRNTYMNGEIITIDGGTVI